jgi:glyoxylase-like metal-dependent hydrolase (beta-lactamase superfamily II)
LAGAKYFILEGPYSAQIWFCGPFNLFPSAFIVVFNQQRKTVEMKDGLHKFKPVRQSHTMKKNILIFVQVLLAMTAHAQQNFDDVRIEPVKLTDHIYMLKGSGGNIGVLTGPDGIIMIDDQYAPLAEKIKAAISKLDTGKITFLVNTHIHGDHSGGNENFKQSGVTIVAHSNVRGRMMAENDNEETGQKGPARSKEAWPVITFSTNVNFHMNNEDIEVVHFTAGHTDGDVIIHFVQSDIFHAGDSFVRYGYPYIDLRSGGSVEGFIANLDKLLAMMDNDSRVIPGHGEVASKTDVQALRDQLRDIYDQVAAALKEGTKMEDLAGLPIATKYDSILGMGNTKGRDFLLTVAESYLNEHR